MGKVWERYGKGMGKVWERYGKVTEKVWERYEKGIGKVWERYLIILSLLDQLRRMVLHLKAVA